KLDGSFSLCIELSDCRRGFWHIWQVIEVKEKESYEVKLAYKAVGWSNNHIMLVVRDAARGWFVLNRAESLLPSEGWKITVLRFKVPEGTHKVRISFYQYLPKDYNPREEKWSSSGAIWVDSVSLRRVK
ncbi:MAG: hypothetical protein N2234_07360, partial [Planctomycetota bacterium]|nr:hypothetical protein [Planctomycetota bacterium]